MTYQWSSSTFNFKLNENVSIKKNFFCTMWLNTGFPKLFPKNGKNYIVAFQFQQCWTLYQMVWFPICVSRFVTKYFGTLHECKKGNIRSYRDCSCQLEITSLFFVHFYPTECMYVILDSIFLPSLFYAGYQKQSSLIENISIYSVC